MNKIGCLVPGADTYTENRLVGLTKVRKNILKCYRQPLENNFAV